MRMKKRHNIFLILCGVLVWFLTDAVRLKAAAIEALALCANSVIPALFPFLAVSGLLVSLGFGTWLSPLFSGLMAPLYRLPGIAGSAVLLGLTGGYPIGAKTAAQLYEQGELTREETVRLLHFCNNSNPAFLISVLGVGVFGRAEIGVWLWLIHVLSALLTGLLFRGRRVYAARSAPPVRKASPSFAAAFVSSVREAAHSMVSVCGFVVLFYVLASPLRELGGRPAMALTGVAELFSLVPLLTPDRFGFILAAGISGWGGLSVLAQTAAVLEESGLPLRPCLAGKTVQGLLSAMLAALLTPVLF